MGTPTKTVYCVNKLSYDLLTKTDTSKLPVIVTKSGEKPDNGKNWKTTANSFRQAEVQPLCGTGRKESSRILLQIKMCAISQSCMTWY